MLNILSILNFIALDAQRNPERFKVIDDQHLLDTKTGIKLHLYDDYFKITHDNAIVATKGDFTEDEQKAIWRIKQSITDPVISEEKRKNYQIATKARREALASLFENPKPILAPTPEESTVEYTG